MNTMTYKRYTARIKYSDEDRRMIGHILGINDVVGFHSDSVAESSGKSINKWVAEALNRAMRTNL